MEISFRDYLLCEDLATDVMNLQSQIAALQSRKARINKPIDDQIVRLQQILNVKQKQLADQKARQSSTTAASV